VWQRTKWRWPWLVPVGILLVAYVLVVSPWVVRNSVLAGRPTNISTGAGWSLYVSAQQYAEKMSYQLLRPEWDVIIAEFNRRSREAEVVARSGQTTHATDAPASVRQEALRDAAYARDAISMLRGVGVLPVLADVPKRLWWLWSTADMSPWQTGLFHRGHQVYHVLLVLLAGVGAWQTGRRFDVSLWLIPVYLTSLHLVFHVEPRYTLPARSFLLILAAGGLCRVASLVSLSWELAFRHRRVYAG
jgi:hypothetical protein